jgi:DNA-binding winged helix-turn-helix (wHTH) protein/TolB-like protein/predicted negative regulator of RcsB-dependent stress response
MQQDPIWGYRFGEFNLDLARRRLTRNGQEVMAPSGRAFEVLAYLIANRDRMVSKRELLDAVWPSVVVEENNLSQAISILRRVLGESREEPRFVVTVARRGYKFIGEATPLAGPAGDVASPDAPLPALLPPEEPAPTPALPPPNAALPPQDLPPAARPGGVPADESQRAGRVSRRAMLLGAGTAAIAIAAGAVWSLRPKPSSRFPASIAVLPFKPLLSDSRDEAIEVGVAELLINRLSVLPGVVVMPLSSVRRFGAPELDPLQAGRELDVAAVVDGSVQIRDGNVRLTARLLDVATGESLWAGNYTEKLGDFFAMQDSLASQLVSALASDIPLDARRRLVARSTSDAEAWQLYANGRYQLQLRDPKGFLSAREYFQAAERLDPRFALATTGLSEAWALAAVFGMVPPVDAFAQARGAAQRALAIDPQLPQALVALGHVKTQFDLDFDGGRSQYRQALALAPNAAGTYSYLALNSAQSGSIASALDYIAQAQALEPAAMPFMAIGGFIEYFARQYDSARRRLSGVLQSAPDAVLPRQFLARVLLALGQGQAVLRLLDGRNETAPGSFSNLGRAYAEVGNVDAARAEIARAEGLGAQGFGVGFDLALMHLALGENDQALAALERAVDDHSQMIGYLNVEPALDPIRADERFRAVAKRIGLA